MLRCIIIPLVLVAHANPCWTFAIPKPKLASVADANAKKRWHHHHHFLTKPTSYTVIGTSLHNSPTDIGTIEHDNVSRDKLKRYTAQEQLQTCNNRPKQQQSRETNNNSHHQHDHISRDRRTVLATLISSLPLTNIALHPTSAAAATASNNDDYDEFGSPMNELTRQIRKSVVRGAQLIDKVDGQWEQFSDDFGLGSERNRPKWDGIDAGGNGRSKKVVRSEVVVGDVNDLVLDEKFAFGILEECDEAFLSCLKSQQSQSSSITKQQLNQQIDDTKQKLRKSFFSSPNTPTPIEEFNFECYIHFRVFNEILVKQNVIFPPFQKEFESVIGNRFFQLASMQQQQQPSLLLLPSPAKDATTTMATSLQNALDTTDTIATLLQSKGFITSWERSIPPDDDMEDFTSTTKPSTDNFSVSSDLPYSLALNGDITLNSQLLLQELGYRLYPSFGRWLVREGVTRCFAASSSSSGGSSSGGGGNKIVLQIDDYYMDTGYSSNPDLFEVKQVLLNIVIQRD